MTTFLVKETFKFTARQSVVFFGDILEGTVRLGQIIKFNATENHPELQMLISGVDFLDNVSEKTSQIGLMVKCDNEGDVEKLINFKIKNEVGQIINNE